MARADSASQSATTQARKSVVGYRTNCGKPNPTPQLTLKGRWLEPLGFTTGQKIEVLTEPGKLIIRIEPTPEDAA
ncbi:SymE family type I addiction module toxin [Serratia symbiotica]|uniref:SymE family type I addiction module toxin n=1 Tax=Serratia symbiotica TaxID=138074 RepID=UPI0030CD4910|nr:type I toxin-antitoxin system SymE family toxin [Serratia symbiotica]